MDRPFLVEDIERCPKIPARSVFLPQGAEHASAFDG
jgi:hypothetical protein